jgi:hypothetical protein
VVRSVRRWLALALPLLAAGCQLLWGLDDIRYEEGGAAGASGGANAAGGAGGAAGGGSGPGGGPAADSRCVPNEGEGGAACGDQICQAGTYCLTPFGGCRLGCLTERDCAAGEACDLSNAQPDLVGRPVGLCARPPASCARPSPPATCGDVSGGYVVALDVALSSDACEDGEGAPGVGRCAATQAGCEVTFRCDGEAFPVLPTRFQVDAAGKGSFRQSALGATYVCDVTFSAPGGAKALRASCQLEGLPVVCVFEGSAGGP